MSAALAREVGPLEKSELLSTCRRSTLASLSPTMGRSQTLSLHPEALQDDNRQLQEEVRHLHRTTCFTRKRI